LNTKEQLAQEWTTLQNNHESYERSALLIKLVAVVLSAIAWVAGLVPEVLVALVLILWFQEAVLKTWQNRLADRLMALESMLRGEAEGVAQPFQLHSRWLAQRPGLKGLLQDYGRSAVRPTVAFPYVALLLLTLIYL
jgi:hypothetical protein